MSRDRAAIVVSRQEFGLKPTDKRTVALEVRRFPIKQPAVGQRSTVIPIALKKTYLNCKLFALRSNGTTIILMPRDHSSCEFSSISIGSSVGGETGVALDANAEESEALARGPSIIRRERILVAGLLGSSASLTTHPPPGRCMNPVRMSQLPALRKLSLHSLPRDACQLVIRY